MKQHLSDDALLEIVEAGKSHPHLAQCDRCRRLFEEVRDALSLARAEEAPEPSPLFWEHFSTRVRAAVENEANAPADHSVESGLSRILRWRMAWRPVAMVVVLALIVAGAWRLWPAYRGGEVASSSRPAVAQPAGTTDEHAQPQPVAELLEPAADPSWLVIAQVTAHVGAGHVADAGLVLQPDASERAISQLTPSEQQELIRLLQSDPDGDSQ